MFLPFTGFVYIILRKFRSIMRNTEIMHDPRSSTENFIEVPLGSAWRHRMWVNCGSSGSVCVRQHYQLTLTNCCKSSRQRHAHSHVRIDSSSKSPHSMKVGESSVVQNHTRISTCWAECPGDLAWNGLIFCSHKENDSLGE